MKLLLSSLVLLIFSFLSNATFAVTKVTISDVHICCVTCQEAIEHAVLGVKGTNVKVDRDAKTVAVNTGIAPGSNFPAFPLPVDIDTI